MSALLISIIETIKLKHLKKERAGRMKMWSALLCYEFFKPSINILITSGRLNCEGGVIPFRSISRTFVPDKCRWSSLLWGHVLLEAIFSHLVQ